MRRGFTLTEMLIALAITTLAVVVAVGLWIMFMYKSLRANTQAELDMDVRNVIERFRTEVRNTARETIVFYPEQREPYAAVSFALAADDDGDGLMDMDASGSNILWRQTVVYHVWNRSPYQMRRTLFRNRYPDASYADRYNQVAAVVMSGEGEGACLAGESATTSVMFQNLFTGRLWHATARFDGYSPRPNVAEKITFGSLPLAPGAHQVNFKIVGKNPDASARRLRLDQVSASISGWPVEAEHCSAEGVSATPFFVGQGLSSAAYGLTAATAADGDTLSLTLYNDMIEECIFTRPHASFSNTVVRLDLTNAPAPFRDGVIVAKLEGQYKTAWWGSVQAAMHSNPDQEGRDCSATVDYLFRPDTNYVVRIPVFGEYVRVDGFGPVFRMYKSFYNGGLQIYDPAYAVTTNLSGPSIGSGIQLHPLSFWQNGVKKADWASCAEGGVDLRPDGPLDWIFAGQGLMFSCRMEPTVPGVDAIRAFDITSAAGKEWTCWAVPGTTAEIAEIARRNDWSGFDVQPLYRKIIAENKAFAPGLVCMTVNYADEGEYTSTVFDTRDEEGVTKTVSWEVDTPAGSTFKLYARGGNVRTDDGFDIVDAAGWQSVAEAANGGGFAGSGGRYVQFRCVLEAQQARTYPAGSSAGGVTGTGPYRRDTPRVRRVCFNWPGAEKYVDVSATVLKGPDCGIFAVDVDGRELVQGVTMEIEIFKDIRAQTGRRERLRSAMTAEVEPRNSGK
ncbi:MAG TPA: type II secretion system protein [Kiritimatiellia bacterium]|nr:type II secretion system protein [Kiritimatiellia bacterium]